MAAANIRDGGGGGSQWEVLAAKPEGWSFRLHNRVVTCSPEQESYPQRAVL